MKQAGIKKYKIRHDWVGKVIYWELCKRLKFEHTTKWHMQKLESFLEDAKNSLGSYDTNVLSNSENKT